MVHANEFSYGLLTPGLAFAMSCVGSFLGLRCAGRARACAVTARAGWLLLAAVSIGATGIWVMHNIALLGFTVPGQTIRYDVPMSLLSVLIAVAAATLSLWAALRQRGIRAAAVASVAMGVAISGMHYTAMAAMRFTATPGAAGPLGGATAAEFVLPLVLVISILTFILITSVALAPTEDQIRAEAALSERLDHPRRGRARETARHDDRGHRAAAPRGTHRR